MAGHFHITNVIGILIAYGLVIILVVSFFLFIREGDSFFEKKRKASWARFKTVLVKSEDFVPLVVPLSRFPIPPPSMLRGNPWDSEPVPMSHLPMSHPHVPKQKKENVL